MLPRFAKLVKIVGQDLVKMVGFEVSKYCDCVNSYTTDCWPPLLDKVPSGAIMYIGQSWTVIRSIVLKKNVESSHLYLIQY